METDYGKESQDAGTHAAHTTVRCHTLYVSTGTSIIAILVAILFYENPATEDALDMLEANEIPFRMKVL